MLFGNINLGILYNELERPDQALTYLEEARQLAEITGAEADLGKIYIELGVAYRLKEIPARAEAYARQAEQVFRRYSDLRNLSRVWNNLGLASLDQGRWAEARRYFEAIPETRRKLGIQHEEVRSLVYLLEYDLVQGKSAQVVKKLHRLESLFDQNQSPRFRNYLHSVLAKYDHVLAKAA